MTTSSYAIHEIARWRDDAWHGAEPNPGRRDAFDAVLELLETENERGNVLGFKNHATAQVCLWLENERPMLAATTTITNEVRASADEAPAVTIGDRLRTLIEGRPAVLLVTEGPNPEDLGHVADLLNAALDAVDWRGLGEHFLATVDDPGDGWTPKLRAAGAMLDAQNDAP